MMDLALALLIIPLALGTYSSLNFLWEWTIGTPTVASSSALLLAVAAGTIRLFIYLRRRAPKIPMKVGGIWMPLFVVALAFAGYWTFQEAKAVPHGGFDAVAIWNLHARFLFRGGAAHWKDVFDNALGWSQNDYPFLLPALVSGIWAIVGSSLLVVPAIVSKIFALLAVGIVCTATSALSRDQRGWLAGLILLATPSFLASTSHQMADTPLSLYILTTIVFLRFAYAWPELRTVMLILAGLSAGFAAWTKNEGLVFALVVFLVYFATAAYRTSWREAFKDTVILGLGIAPVFLLIISFKAMLAPPGDVELNQAALERLTVVGRYSETVVAFRDHLMSFGNAQGGLSPGILMGLYVLLYMRPGAKISYASWSLLLLPALMMAAYFFFYLITPYDLTWHLMYSLDRLLLQLWPPCVFILASVTVFTSEGTGTVGRVD